MRRLGVWVLLALGTASGCGSKTALNGGLASTTDAGTEPSGPPPAGDAPPGVTDAGSSCPQGLSRCAGECVDLESGARNCGACGRACGASEVCSAGTCQALCAEGEVDCAGACVDPLTDAEHCGATEGCGTTGGSAGSQCEPGQYCSRGACLECRTLNAARSYKGGFDGDSFRDIAVADVDGDGKLDLVTDGVIVLLGNGDGSFVKTWEFEGEHLGDVALADLNGDQKTDLLRASWLTGNIQLFAGAGDGTFLEPTPIATSEWIDDIALADLDGDGALDLVLSGGGRVGVLTGNGEGTFAPPQAFVVGPAVSWTETPLVVEDFDADGVLDIATARMKSMGEGDNAVVVMLGRGDGNFGKVTQVSPDLIGWSTLVAGDLNGDGRMDLRGGNALLLGRGDGSFDFSEDEVLGSGTLADLDSDGRLDLVQGGISQGPTVSLGNGDGTFGAPSEFIAGYYPGDVFAADLDADGRLDLITLNHLSYDLSVALGHGNGSFKAAQPVDVDGFTGPLAVADADGDQKLDLVSAASNSWRGEYWLRFAHGFGDGSFEPMGELVLERGTSVVQAADFNADGWLDLITTEHVWLGQPDGAFHSGFEFGSLFESGFHAMGAVRVVDLNRDGDLDLVGSYLGGLLGRGDGTFERVQEIFLGGRLSLGDFDADGNIDVAGPAYLDFLGPPDQPGILRISRGNGDGTFAEPRDIEMPLALGPNSIASGDFDADGWLDVATANYYSDDVSVLYGRGDGTFDDVVSWPAGDGASEIVAGDLDGRAGDDLVVLNHDDATITVLFSTGGAGFRAENFSVGQRASYYGYYEDGNVALADLDGNGLLDVVVSGLYGPRIILGVLAPECGGSP